GRSRARAECRSVRPLRLARSRGLRESGALRDASRLRRPPRARLLSLDLGLPSREGRLLGSPFSPASARSRGGALVARAPHLLRRGFTRGSGDRRVRHQAWLDWLRFGGAGTGLAIGAPLGAQRGGSEQAQEGTDDQVVAVFAEE